MRNKLCDVASLSLSAQEEEKAQLVWISISVGVFKTLKELCEIWS